MDAYAEKPDKKKKDKTDDGEICRTMMERYARWQERERHNIDAGYDDLRFVYEDEHWPGKTKQEREAEGRPCLTVNRLGQFVHQVTGDMRMKKPSAKAVPVDSRGDKDTADTISGMIRYVENRSDASAAYMSGADIQVAAGFGAWRVTKEYADGTTFNQELRIMGVDDALAIAWDTDAVLPTREDAKWVIVPVDMSHESFKEQYPDSPMEDFDDASDVSVGWYDKDTVRVAEYWVKKPIKRTLALLPDGGIDDLTDETPEKIAELKAIPNIRIEERPGYQVCRYLCTACHVLEGPDEWPGMFIPIVPVIGEEIRIGKKVVRRGLIRPAKDAQRLFNYFISAHAEVVALQPKAPFTGTEKNFEKYQEEWAQANNKALPFLPYTPDAANGGAAPQRVQPPVSSDGIIDGINLAVENMKGTIGIYDAGLGQRSNETSGKAILARQHEGDIGTAHYSDNWARGILYTGKILIDLIPHVYDTERMIRIMGEDGKVDLKWINKPKGMVETDPNTGLPVQSQTIENDVTVGAYDVVLETGPSYSTKREESKESLQAFIQATPEMAPVMLDLYAKMQDWPLADELAKRFEAVAPDPVKKLIAQQKQEAGEEDKIQQPSPQEQMAQQAQQMAMKLELEGKKLANDKLQAETQKIMSESGQGQDPSAAIKAQGEQIKIQNEARRAELDYQIAMREAESRERIAAVELEIKLADLAIKKHGLALDTASAALDLGSKQQGMVHDAESHTANLVRDMETHQSSMTRGEEAHQAKLKQMQEPKRPTA